MGSTIDPVSLGSERTRSVTTDSFLLTDCRFPPTAVLSPHRHARGIFAVMLEGSFEAALWHRRLECTPATVWTEPAEERHANYIGPLGARVVVVQPDPERMEFFAPVAGLTHVGSVLHDPSIAADARRICAELDVGDALTPVAIESLVLLMIATAARAMPRTPHAPSLPSWLSRARDVVHARFLTGFRLADVADDVGVHPSHLAHEFRRHFRSTVGQYARQLRFQWAVNRIRSTDDTLAHIALAAGYSDQAHLTRHCTRMLGVSPARLRKKPRPENETAM
jgi:AraC family transcriptional regulator